MGTLIKVLTIGIILNAMAMCSRANAGEAGISGGIVDGQSTAGAYIKLGKYSVDGHMGMSENKKAVSIGMYREVVDFSKLGLQIGVGLSANQSTVFENNIKTKRTYQGYDLELNYDLKKFKIRSTINSNGDIKAGIGFSF